MAANVVLGANNVITLALGGGDAQPAEIDWTVNNPALLGLVSMSGQPEFQVQVRPVGAGVATVTATLKDRSGNVLQAVNQNVQVAGADPESAAVSFTASAATAIPAAPGAADPGAPGGAHDIHTGAAPGVVAGAGANGGPVGVAGNDARGQVTWGTGAAPAIGDQVVVTFHAPYGGAVPAVVVTAANDATGALGPEVDNITANGFAVRVRVAPAANQAAGTYVVEYEVEG